MAGQVTISTFLELKDNLSPGLSKVNEQLVSIEVNAHDAAQALEKLRKAAGGRGGGGIGAAASESAQSAVSAQKAVERSLLQTQRAADAAALEQQRAANRAQLEIVKAAEKSALAQQKARQAELQAAQKASASAILAEQKHKQAQIRTADAAIREAARAERFKEAAMARERMHAERLALQRMALEHRLADAAIREARRVEREKQRTLERDQRESRRGGIFGTLVGANVTANLVTAGLNMARNAATGFFDKVADLGAQYEQQTASIAGSIFTRGVETSYSKAESLSRELMGQMVTLAAKLPGEAKDYIEVFSRTLPSALSGGQKDMKQFVDFISKYSALAINLGKAPGVAATQMVEMLEGHVRTTTSMYKFLEQFTGYTSRQWSDPKLLTSADRLRIAIEAVNKAGAALPATARDAVSVFGTLKSAWDMMFVVEGSKFFESQKIAATELTKILDMPMIKSAMDAISEGVGNLVVGVVIAFKMLFEKAQEFMNWVSTKMAALPGLREFANSFKAAGANLLGFSPLDWLMTKGAEAREAWRKQARPEILAEGGVPTREGAPKDRSGVYQDFRYSRFDINQAFAEGFDPDRIAVAFATNLARVGEMKVQSLNTPNFSSAF